MKPLKLRRDFISNVNVQKNLQAFYNKPVLRVSFELVMSILVVVVFALFALRPTLITMSDLLKEIEEKKKLDKDLQQKIAALATAQNEWSVYRQQVENFKTAFFDSPSMEEVLLYLEYLARQDGIVMTSVTSPEVPVILEKTVSTPSAGISSSSVKQLTPVDANLQFIGSYANILNFLVKLEQRQPLFSVENLSFNSSQVEENADPMINANVKIRLYILKEGVAETQSVKGNSAARNAPAADEEEIVQ
jgi:hypothetical protein